VDGREGDYVNHTGWKGYDLRLAGDQLLHKGGGPHDSREYPGMRSYSIRRISSEVVVEAEYCQGLNSTE
jgi:hypothetical protein